MDIELSSREATHAEKSATLAGGVWLVGTLCGVGRHLQAAKAHPLFLADIEADSMSVAVAAAPKEEADDPVTSSTVKDKKKAKKEKPEP